MLAALPLVNACAAPSEDVEANEGAASAPEACSLAECPKTSGPDVELSYEELLELQSLRGKWSKGRYEVFGGRPELVAKVNTLLTTPFISNEAFHAGARKFSPTNAEFGATVPTMRTVAWNIERGENLEGIQEMLKASNTPASRNAYIEKLRAGKRLDDKQVAELRAELEAIAQVDVFILNEVDRGMARSHFKNVVAELANELRMNYAYGIEFIEVDPLALGNETFGKDDFKTYDAKTGQLVEDTPDEELSELARNAKQEMDEVAAAMRARRGLIAVHGNAILSRYPIRKDVKITRFETAVGAKKPKGRDAGEQAEIDRTWKKAACWDWNTDERQEAGFVDGLLAEGQNLVAEKVFLEKAQRQIRHGGRFFMTANLVVNGLDGKDLTVIDAHLEAKATPGCRRDQMEEILATVDAIQNPIVLGGDLNTTGTNGMPMTLGRLLFDRFKKPEYWARQITTRLLRSQIPWVGWAWTAFDVFKFLKKQDDPTSIFHPEHKLFGDVKEHGFDFRGEKLRTVKTAAKTEGTKGTLANSNQRDKKGFKTTFSVERPIGFIGKMKLDWIMVRPFSPGDKKAYRMAPHFARTLEDLNNAPSERLSDHYPLVVTLPILEPCLGKKAEECTLPPAPEETGPDNYDVSYETSPDVALPTPVDPTAG